MIQRLILLVLIAFLMPVNSFAQNGQDEKDLVQFSGLVLTADSLQVLPYVTIINERDHRGTYTDINGFFTLVGRKGDTIRFLYIGYQPSYYIIPDSLSKQKYSMVKLMTEDTTYLDEAIVRPLPSRELFDYYFVNADIPDDDTERARKNLERQKLREAAEAMGADGMEIGKRHLAQQAQKYYYAGQLPPNNLLNPFAWAQFFEAWKRGDFKRQKKN